MAGINESESRPRRKVSKWIFTGLILLIGLLMAVDLVYWQTTEITIYLFLSVFVIVSFTTIFLALSRAGHPFPIRVLMSCGLTVVAVPSAMIAMVCLCTPAIYLTGTEFGEFGIPNPQGWYRLSTALIGFAIFVLVNYLLSVSLMGILGGQR